MKSVGVTEPPVQNYCEFEDRIMATGGRPGQEQDRSTGRCGREKGRGRDRERESGSCAGGGGDGLDDCADNLDRMKILCLVSEADTRRGTSEAEGGLQQRCVECDSCNCTVVLNWKSRGGRFCFGVFISRKGS